MFIDAIELYPEKMDDGRIIRQIDLAFPVYYEGFEGEAIRLLNENYAGSRTVKAVKNDTARGDGMHFVQTPRSEASCECET